MRVGDGDDGRDRTRRERATGRRRRPRRRSRSPRGRCNCDARFRTREATFARIFEPGARACAERGTEDSAIAALGAKLSLQRDRGDGDEAAAPAIAATVTTGLTATPALRKAASKRFGPASGLTRKVGALLAAGTSVCGVTAIGGLAPAIGASQREIGVAVANVAAYGTLGMLAYPWIGEAVVSGGRRAGGGVFGAERARHVAGRRGGDDVSRRVRR